MHQESIDLIFDLFISTVVYACVSLLKVTKLVPYIDDAREAIVDNIVIGIGEGVTIGSIE
jgi:hypothetical protein